MTHPKRTRAQENSNEGPRPARSRPYVPGYGIPASPRGMLTWEHVRGRMKASMNYWIATTGPDSRPHATPVWGVWLDDRLYFDGSPETRRGRNLRANPAAAVHLEDGSDVVILHGEAREMKDPDRSLTIRISEGYTDKYQKMGYAPKPDQWDGGGLYEFRPSEVFAWTQFPKDATRWTLRVE